MVYILDGAIRIKNFESVFYNKRKERLGFVLRVWNFYKSKLCYILSFFGWKSTRGKATESESGVITLDNTNHNFYLLYAEITNPKVESYLI